VKQINTPVSGDDLFAIEAAVFPEGHRYDVGSRRQHDPQERFYGHIGQE
jgi:hypothetical protein